MNRNHERVLSEQQIKDITEQVKLDLIKYAQETADTLVDHYLRGDAEGLMVLVDSWVEGAEDEVLDMINTQLTEDSFKQAENEYIS